MEPPTTVCAAPNAFRSTGGAHVMQVADQQYDSQPGEVSLPQQPVLHGAQQAPANWTKYYIQRVSTNVNHVLFYVVDEAGLGKLAVVGTDVKLSGHFVYASVSDMTEAPPLRCTNRQKVLEWLSDLGASELAEDHEVTLPQLAPHHWQQLHSSNPMLCKPQLDRNYRSWREDSGVLPDGRHFKHYFLVDAATGAERLAVVGEDSARLDRRYTYKALEDVGGFCFENGKAVSDWLDFVVGKTSEPPSSLVRRDKPPERKRSSKKRRGGTTTEDEPDAQDFRIAAGPASHFPFSHSPHSAAAVADTRRPPTLFSPGGMPPPSGRSIYSAGPQHYLGHQHFQAPPAKQPPAARYGTGALQTLGPAGPGGLSTPGGGASGAPVMTDSGDLDAAVRAAGEEVRQLFAVGGQPLLEFVTHVPNQGSIDIVSEMSRRLSSFVDALGLTGQAGPCNVPAAEVSHILSFLGERPASLKLLETTGIGHPVALLGCMHDVLAAQGQQLTPDAARELQPVYELARQLAAAWQDLAATAHKLANEALEANPGPL